MENLNSVIRVVERCSPKGCWEECPYYKSKDCEGSLREDILALLKDYRRRLGKCHNCGNCYDLPEGYGCRVLEDNEDTINPFGNCPCWIPMEE